MSLDIRLAYNDTESVAALFSKYIKLLTDLESGFLDYLKIQDYDSEIRELGEKYGLPGGRLYIAYFENQAAGCIALRKISGSECEMKRLYVEPQFRHCGIGNALVRLIINDAREIGYKYMLLDTLPALNDAIKLYEKAGFYRIPPYNDSPVKNTVYMKLEL